MKNTRRILKSQRGIALMETLPLLVIFVMLMSFGMGLFGVIHTGILHSIAARTYAFETMRQRTNLTYFRENLTGLSSAKYFYNKKGWRLHAIQHETDPRPVFIATVRPIALGRNIASGDDTETTNNVGIYSMQPRNDHISVNPAWVMVGYGICLNAECGD